MLTEYLFWNQIALVCWLIFINGNNLLPCLYLECFLLITYVIFASWKWCVYLMNVNLLHTIYRRRTRSISVYAVILTSRILGFGVMSQNMDGTTLPVGCFVFGGFGWLVSTQLTLDLTLECCGESQFRPLLHTGPKNVFYFAKTALNRSQHNLHVNILGSLWINRSYISKTTFWANVYAKWSQHVSLSSLRRQASPATLRLANMFLWTLGEWSFGHHWCF